MNNTYENKINVNVIYICIAPLIAGVTTKVSKKGEGHDQQAQSVEDNQSKKR